jgi:hypothetical protein
MSTNQINCDVLYGLVVVDIATPSVLLSTKQMITHVYYTESDQIVNFQSVDVIYALSNASGADTLFMGARQEKSLTTEAILYGEGLRPTRLGCGQSGYVLNWPKDRVVKKLNSSDESPIPEVYKKHIVTADGGGLLHKRIVQRTKQRTSSSVAGLQMQSSFTRIKSAVSTTI